MQSSVPGRAQRGLGWHRRLPVLRAPTRSRRARRQPGEALWICGAPNVPTDHDPESFGGAIGELVCALKTCCMPPFGSPKQPPRGQRDSRGTGRPSSSQLRELHAGRRLHPLLAPGCARVRPCSAPNSAPLSQRKLCRVFLRRTRAGNGRVGCWRTTTCLPCGQSWSGMDEELTRRASATTSREPPREHNAVREPARRLVGPKCCSVTDVFVTLVQFVRGGCGERLREGAGHPVDRSGYLSVTFHDSRVFLAQQRKTHAHTNHTHKTSKRPARVSDENDLPRMASQPRLFESCSEQSGSGL